MDLLATQWMIGLLGFAAGIAVGALIYHFTRSDEGAHSQMAEQVEQLEAEQQEYREEVAQHFARTADLVNQLTESYRDVHAHLSQGAQTLCDGNEALRDQLQNSLANRLIVEPESEPEPEEKPAKKSSGSVEPPKDYAPKSDPKGQGTLSEDYGLKKKKETGTA